MNAVAASVEEIVRAAEVDAVANVIRQTGSVQVGQMIDYRVDPRAAVLPPERRTASRPYRLLVEQWHIDAAAAMLLQSRRRTS